MKKMNNVDFSKVLSVDGRQKKIESRIMAIEQGRELLVVLWYQRRFYGVYEPGRSVELGSVSRPLLDYCWLIINYEHSVDPKRYVLRMSLRVSSTEISRASS